jgi:hypothetical protein
MGAIKIIKQTEPPSTASFEFTGVGEEPFLLSDTEVHHLNVSPGTYNIQELVPDGWAIHDIQCTEQPYWDNATPTIVNVDSATATIGLDAIEVVTCTFFNVRLSLDADNDGLTDDFESGFGGSGVTVSGAGSTSSTGDAESGSTITADDVTVTLPPGTTASTPDSEISITVLADPPAAALSGIVLPPGETKSLTIPIGGKNAICIDDSAAATIESVATGVCASPKVEIGVPAAVGDSNTANPYVVTRTSDTHVRVDGLMHSAIAMVNGVSGDGNVIARVRFGFATIQGDRGDNAIRVTRGTASHSILVTGIGTTVNGQTGRVELGSVFFGFSMDLMDGDDRVFFEGDGVPLIGGNVRTGSGNDLVRFDAFNADGNPALLSVNTGDDQDELIVQGSLLPAISFELGRGSDRVSAVDSVFGGPVAILTQEGDDDVRLEATHFRRSALVALGKGNDLLRIGSPVDATRACRFDRALALFGDAGFDVLDAGLLSNPNANGNDLGSPLVVGFEQ